jgi:inorganic pyrophosphatase
MTYPADYGYVEGTLGEDGDPLVLVSDPTFNGWKRRRPSRRRPAGKRGRVKRPWGCRGSADNVSDVNAELRDEIEHFFQRYKDVEPTNRTETRGWGNRSEAASIVVAARARA